MLALPQRFTALDVFRGMTVCFMIIVNTSGNWDTTFSPLLHAQWHGFTPTDLVFPSFLFAVGNSISFVMKKWATMPRGKVIGKILKRTLIIFLLGYLMYWFPFVRLHEGHYELSPIANTRIFGVLQRIALCYGIASLLALWFRPKALAVWGAAFILLYWVLLYWLGHPADPLSLQGNAVLRVDRMLMADTHIYHGEGVPFDPEGLLSTLPAIANVLGGLLVGNFLQRKEKNYETLSSLMLAGFALSAIGYFWHTLLPINKKLWTGSFVVYTVGLDCIILAAIIYISDFKKKNRWNYFFEVFGRNTLFIYLLSEVLAILMYFIPVGEDGQSLYGWTFDHIFKPAGMYTGALLFAVSFMMLNWLVGYWLDKKKIYIKV